MSRFCVSKDFNPFVQSRWKERAAKAEQARKAKKRKERDSRQSEGGE